MVVAKKASFVVAWMVRLNNNIQVSNVCAHIFVTMRVIDYIELAAAT